MPTRPAAKKRKGDVKEDIANNQFGEDFAMENVTALMNAEVQAILAMSVDTQQVDEQSEMMQNSIQYCEAIGKFQDVQSCTNCKNELMNKGADGEPAELGKWGGQNLNSFEAAMLGNLQPHNAEEAKSLIKSLSRFSDTDVEEMCQIVQRFKASS